MLRGTTLRQDEFEKKLLAIREQFNSILVLDDDSEMPRFRVEPEAARELEEMSEELGLPPSGLGNIFWAVFWHLSVLQQPIEAVWVQKLAHHVDKADVSLCRKDEAAEATYRLIEVALFTLRGCLRACVLSPIARLVKTTTALIQDAPAAA